MYDKLKLWFFRDLTDYQRRQLFSVFGMPVDEIGYSHGKQEVALRHAVQSLITAKPDTTPPAPHLDGSYDYATRIRSVAEVLLIPDGNSDRIAIYDACANRVKVYKFDAVLRAIVASEGSDNG